MTIFNLKSIELVLIDIQTNYIEVLSNIARLKFGLTPNYTLNL